MINYYQNITIKYPQSSTGKERDSETGFSYFGARFYDSDLMTGWLSVDPMADKYPNISPYAYCGWTRPTGADEHRLIEFNIANNPVWLVDPDGEEIFASVQSNNVGVNANNTPVIKAKIFLPEGYTPNGEIRATTDFLFANAEMWMNEPATSEGDFCLKTLSQILYSSLDDISIVATGTSQTGTEVTQTEKEDTFAGLALLVVGGITRGIGIIKPKGETELAKYNDFVKKMGNYQGRSKKEMGILYQNNKELNNVVSTHKKVEKGLSGVSQLEKDD